MKAIKDCEWKVSICNSNYLGIKGYFWWANSKEITGIYGHQESIIVKSKKEAKHNWEKFAKINKIKKWKYV
jgi:hypothetical protein